MKCPNCESDLHELLCYEVKKAFFSLDGDRPYYDEVIEFTDVTYNCPDCDEKIAEDELEAIRFLEGDILKTGDVVDGIELLECPNSPSGEHEYESTGRFHPGKDNFYFECKHCMKSADIEDLGRVRKHEREWK